MKRTHLYLLDILLIRHNIVFTFRVSIIKVFFLNYFAATHFSVNDNENFSILEINNILLHIFQLIPKQMKKQTKTVKHD